MAGRKNIKSRNEEVRQVFRHLRKIERRESSYCMEEISKNYHISQDRIYQILAQPDEPGCIENPSFIIKNNLTRAMNLNLEYMVKIGDNPATIYYSFDGKTKMVRGVRITGNVELHQVRWVLSNAPSSEGDLIKNFQKRVGKKVIIKYVPVDITFADFWEKYGNKIGKKKEQNTCGDCSIQKSDKRP